jgi:hypothetical protein
MAPSLLLVPPPPAVAPRGWLGHLAALLLGAGLGLGGYALAVLYGPVEALSRQPLAPVQAGLLGWGLAILAARAAHLARQAGNLRAGHLPPGPEEPAPAAAARAWRQHLAGLPRRLRRGWLGVRLRAGLDHVLWRQSAADLDGHLRQHAAADAAALAQGHTLTRLLTWLAAALGLVGALYGLGPAFLELPADPGPLPLAAVLAAVGQAFVPLAVGLAMGVTLTALLALVEAGERGVLTAVDHAARAELLPRFERFGAEAGEVVALLRRTVQGLLQTTEHLVQRQAELWNRSQEAMRGRLEQAEKEQRTWLTAQLARLLEQAVQAQHQKVAGLEGTFLDHAGQLIRQCERHGQGLRDTAAALAQQEHRLAEQADQIGRWVTGEQHLLSLQESLNRNLQVLAQAGTFQQVLHSLTAAVHVLTTQAGGPRPRQGAAA